MSRPNLKSLIVSGAFLASFMFLPSEAQAYGNEYCREYTRTVYIGARTQEAYGTACLQPDGSWMIVGEGPMRATGGITDVDYVIHDSRRDIMPPRVVYYNSPTIVHTRPNYVWYPAARNYQRGGFTISYANGGRWRDADYRRYNKRHYDRWDNGRSRGHDHHHHNGRGRGHGRD